MPFPSFITRNLKLGVYWHWFSSSAVPSRNQIVSAFVSSYTCFLPHACDFVCIKLTQLQASRSCSRQDNVKGSLFFFKSRKNLFQKLPQKTSCFSLTRTWHSARKFGDVNRELSRPQCEGGSQWEGDGNGL